jgi:hypothetical protein
MARACRSVRKTPHAPSQVSSKSQAGDLRKEVDGSPPLGGGADTEEQVRDAEGATAKQDSGQEPEEAGREVLPVEDSSLFDSAVSPADQEQSLGGV